MAKKHSDPVVRLLILKALVEQGTGPVYAGSLGELRLVLDYPGLIGVSQSTFNAALYSLAYNPDNKRIALWHPRNLDGTRGVAARLLGASHPVHVTTRSRIAAKAGVA